MKRKTKIRPGDIQHVRPRFLQMLRICMFLSFTSIFSMQALAAYSQNLNLSLQNIRLEQVLETIEKQTEYYFVYNHQLVDVSREVSIEAQEKSVEEVLNSLFKNTDIHYSIVDRQVVLYKKDNTSSPTGHNLRPLPYREQTLVLPDKQGGILKGKVTDENNQPMPGVNVLFKGTLLGAVTDVNGHFSLNRPAGGEILVVSMIGYKTQEIKIGDRTEIQIQLEPDIKKLEEVVITGYQTVDKRTFTGSVSKIDVDRISQAGSGDIGKMLQGAVAGVTVENVSGTFGTKSKIRIRGNSSISGNQEPLWVIDGVVLDDPVNVNPYQLYSCDASTLLSSAISGINPDDIEDIQILKDAAATAMYGTQAVNGVIVVTTKKGKEGKTTIN